MENYEEIINIKAGIICEGNFGIPASSNKRFFSIYLLVLTVFICLFLLRNEIKADDFLFRYKVENLDLLYIGKDLSYLVPHTARCFENAYNFHGNFWDYKSKEPVRIIFNDFNDIGNGGALVNPWKTVLIGVEAFDNSLDVVPSNERMQWLMEHELTHIVMADKPSGADKFYRSIFGGKVQPVQENPISMIYGYLTTPRWYSPRWFHEGIACFMETWLSGGLGRTLGNYDEMVFRTMVNENSYFYSVVGLETEGTTVDFQIGVNSYLYGTRFVGYLAYKHGLEKLKDFFSRTDSSSAFYASQFKNIYGCGVEEEWDNWINWEKVFQKKNIEKIREFPLTQFREITKNSLGSVSRSYYDKKSGKIIAAVNHPGDMAHIETININDGSRERIAEVGSPGLFYVTTMAYDDSSSTLFFATNNSNWRGLNAVNIETGKETHLLDYTRTGDLAFDRADKSIWGVQHQSGRTILVRIPSPYNRIDRIYTIDYGKSLFDIDISPDGRFLSATLSNVSGRQKLVIAKIEDLVNGKYEFEEIYEFEENVAQNFVFSEDGKYLYGTSYYSGVSNVFRVDITAKNAEIMTNIETGFFRPLPLPGDSLLVFRYCQNGLQPVVIKQNIIKDVNAVSYLGQLIAENESVVKSLTLPPPSKINLDSLNPSEEPYNTFKNLAMSSAFPFAEAYKSYPAYGWQFNFQDLTGINRISLKLAYSPNIQLPKKERIHAFLDYNYWLWNFKAAYNQTDFYDFFGPTKRSRAGYFFALKYKDFLIINRKPQEMDYFFYGATFGDLQVLPDYQNVSASFDKLHVLAANFHYSYLRKSLGAVEYEQGIDFKLYSYNNYVNKSLIPKLYMNFDAGILLPLRNSSVWLRTSAGQSFGDTNSSFTNFYFGGFGNNYVDMYSAQRYRETESFPGIEINEASGRNYAKALLEWNLSPIRFRKLGFLGFYSTYTRLSLFGAGLSLDMDKENKRRFLFSYGSQLDFELVLFSLLKSTLSFGYGISVEKCKKPSKEFMVSLKIL